VKPCRVHSRHRDRGLEEPRKFFLPRIGQGRLGRFIFLVGDYKILYTNANLVVVWELLPIG